MGVVFAAPGKMVSTGLGKLSLWRPLRTGITDSSPPSPGALPLTSIPNLAGWWNAADFSGILDASGQALTSWNQSAVSVQDRSGQGHPLNSFSTLSSSASLVAEPRVAGLYGAVGAHTQSSNLMMPALSPYHGLSYAGTPPGSGNDWTWWVVWSRPNWRQGTNVDSHPGTILSVGNIPVLQIDNTHGPGRLVLFPSGANATLTAALTRRHTHSVVLRSSITSGVSAWLDGALVAQNIFNSLGASTVGPTLLLHDGTTFGSAQCWFHEGASWSRSLSDGEIGDLLSYTARWPTGPRRGVMLVVDGQSNAINYSLNDGAAQLLARGMAWYIGAIAYNIIASTGAPASYTMESGHGLYPAVGGTYPGSFLNPAGAGNGADPSTWPPGADGIAVANALNGSDPEDLSDICSLVWPWNETDSLREYAERATFQAAASRFLALERQMAGKSAAELPLIWWNAIPYGTAAGMQMHREVTTTLGAMPQMNVVIGNPQTADSNARGSVWDPTTGISTGGDSAHRDSADNRRFAMLAAPIAARAILMAGYGDTITAVPPGIPSVGGPRIVHAFRRDSTSLILTIQHDQGTDIRIPLRASEGTGFTVMDGGSIANPGVLISAIACQRMDATHLLITLGQPLQNASSTCGLYYPYGAGVIGRGNAVTDNFAAVAKPSGWDIGADLGTFWSLDFPLAATATAIPISDVAS